MAELDSAPLIVLDPSNPASEDALDMAVRAAASLCVWLARKDGCAVPAPGDRRPIEIGHDLGAWPAVHARLALVEEGQAPAAGVLGPRGGAVIWVTGADLRPRRARSSGCPPARATWSRQACSRASAPRSRWPAAPAASWSACGEEWRHERAASHARAGRRRRCSRSADEGRSQAAAAVAPTRSSCASWPSRRWAASARRTGGRSSRTHRSAACSSCWLVATGGAAALGAARPGADPAPGRARRGRRDRAS